MAAFNFKKWNTITGWCVFAIALITYTLTVEPTMSFWDCGEYIPTAAKLEVGHPPGAPLFQMLGAFFAMFAFGNEKLVALMVNMMSVFSSAFTILFMFWSSSMILKRVVTGYSELTKTNLVMILGSSAIGALAYTFSDSFWFNAVEAEVYAMAMLLISLLLWLGLRWEQDMHTPRGNRWLLIISLIIGLSFGVHFMALLTIPAIGFLYYFKNYENITIKSFIIANIVVVAILLFIFKLLLPLTMSFFANTEVFMVNELSLPFNSGTIFVALLFIAFFYFGLKFTRSKGYVHLNTGILCILFILIGFSTWMMLPIRANANTVINENKPSDAREVLAYYNREQYGVNPLFYGPQFSDMYAGLDKTTPYIDKEPNYERDYKTGKYVITNNYKNAEQNTADEHKAILPRMWSTEHAENYMRFSRPLEFRMDPNYDYTEDLAQYGIDIETAEPEQVQAAAAQLQSEVEKTVAEFRTAFQRKEIDIEGYSKFLKSYGDYLIIEKPSTIDNLSFMVEYQFGYMYWRYLMWNFTGRQNDVQGKYDNIDGNWMTGITPFDELRLGSQKNLPSDVLNNKGRNLYFALPFILGLIGFIYHAGKDLKSFYILLILFLFTGLALKIYLNERPFEPRERDYALVGSFYVFAIWLGFGVYSIYDSAKKWLSPKILAPLTLGVCLLGAPVLMASQNWDDHDRSGKYTAVSMAKAYLNSCEPNAILFTIGDNDTFPLWYAQEIEKVRTDVRIVNTSLLMTDWYIDQMKAKAYDSDPMPISFTHNQYVGDKLDYIAYTGQSDAVADINSFINFIATDDASGRNIIELKNGQKIHFYPTNKVRIPVDKNAVIANKVVNAKYNDSIVPYIDITIKGQAIYKNRLMMLDIIKNNNWKRPVYFTGGSFGDDDYIWMKDYLQLDGMVYKLVPVRTAFDKESSQLDMGQIDSDKMYDIVMKWDWGNGESPHIYHDPETRKNSISFRTNLARLMKQLIKEGKNDKARKVIDLAMKKMPFEYYGYYVMLDDFVDGYYKLNDISNARQLSAKIIKKYQENLDYYSKLSIPEQNDIHMDIFNDIYKYKGQIDIMKENNDNGQYAPAHDTFLSYTKRFSKLYDIHHFEKEK